MLHDIDQEIEKPISAHVHNEPSMIFEAEIARAPTVEGQPTLIGKARRKGRFYNKLENSILQNLADESLKHGGIIRLSDLVLSINKNRKEKPPPQSEILKALEMLERDGLTPKAQTLGSGMKMISYIDLSVQHKEVLDMARARGWTTMEEVVLKTDPSKEKTELTLKDMESSGMAICRTTAQEGRRWYFPALLKERRRSF